LHCYVGLGNNRTIVFEVGGRLGEIGIQARFGRLPNDLLDCGQVIEAIICLVHALSRH